MADDHPLIPGEVERVGRNLPLDRLRALANQFAICVLLRPVCLWSCSRSSSFGYGRWECVDSQFFKMRTDSLENLAPILGPLEALWPSSPSASVPFWTLTGSGDELLRMSSACSSSKNVFLWEPVSRLKAGLALSGCDERWPVV